MVRFVDGIPAQFLLVARRSKRGWQHMQPRHRKALGQGLVEYSLLLVLIAVVAIGSVSVLGGRTRSVFDEVQCRLSGGTFHQDRGNGNSNRCR